MKMEIGFTYNVPKTGKENQTDVNRILSKQPLVPIDILKKLHSPTQTGTMQNKIVISWGWLSLFRFKKA